MRGQTEMGISSSRPGVEADHRRQARTPEAIAWAIRTLRQTRSEFSFHGALEALREQDALLSELVLALMDEIDKLRQDSRMPIAPYSSSVRALCSAPELVPPRMGAQNRHFSAPPVPPPRLKRVQVRTAVRGTLEFKRTDVTRVLMAEVRRILLDRQVELLLDGEGQTSDASADAIILFYRSESRIQPEEVTLRLQQVSQDARARIVVFMHQVAIEGQSSPVEGKCEGYVSEALAAVQGRGRCGHIFDAVFDDIAPATLLSAEQNKKLIGDLADQLIRYAS